VSTTTAVTTPQRGDQFPDLTGQTPAGAQLSTRDYYMRRNLAVMYVANDATGAGWLRAAGAVRDAAHAEAGEIVVVAPPGMATGTLPTIVDQEQQLAGRAGLYADDLPALFIIDRYRTVFAGNRGEQGLPELTPADIPGWLEFVACRCS
jgi:hypothetical protein